MTPLELARNLAENRNVQLAHVAVGAADVDEAIAEIRNDREVLSIAAGSEAVTEYNRLIAPMLAPLGDAVRDVT